MKKQVFALALIFTFTLSAMSQGVVRVQRYKAGGGGASSFSDNFNRSDRVLAGDNNWVWGINGGGFNIVSNVLRVVVNSSTESLVVNTTVSLADGTVQYDSKVTADNGGTNLVFRYTDVNNLYLVTFPNNATFERVSEASFYKRQGGTWTQLGGTFSSANGTWPLNTFKTCKVVFAGTSVTIYFDGVSLGSWTDSTFTAAGYTGLQTGNGSAVSTNDVDNFSAAP